MEKTNENTQKPTETDNKRFIFRKNKVKKIVDAEQIIRPKIKTHKSKGK